MEEKWHRCYCLELEHLHFIGVWVWVSRLHGGSIVHSKCEVRIAYSVTHTRVYRAPPEHHSCTTSHSIRSRGLAKDLYKGRSKRSQNKSFVRY